MAGVTTSTSRMLLCSFTGMVGLAAFGRMPFANLNAVEEQGLCQSFSVEVFSLKLSGGKSPWSRARAARCVLPRSGHVGAKPTGSSQAVVSDRPTDKPTDRPTGSPNPKSTWLQAILNPSIYGDNDKLRSETDEKAIKRIYHDMGADSEFRQCVEFQGELGEGVNGTIVEATFKRQPTEFIKDGQHNLPIPDLTTSTPFAVKIFDKGAEVDEDVIQEVKMMIHLTIRPHENVAEVNYVFETDKCIYCFMPVYGGGDMFKKYVSNRNSISALTAPLVKRYSREMLEAIAHLHRLGITHFDVKLSNFLISSGPGGELKLIDFGMSAYSNGEREVGTDFLCIRGSPWIIAPELARRDKDKHQGNTNVPTTVYFEKPDIWSLGVVFYRMMMSQDEDEQGIPTGEQELFESEQGIPFVSTELHRSLSRVTDPDKFRELFEKVDSSDLYNIKEESDMKLSLALTDAVEDSNIVTALDLLATMLVESPHDRQTASELLRAHWFTNH